MDALGHISSRDKGRRIIWVDYALGICIVIIVMMYATLDYEQVVGDESWLQQVVVFFRPFQSAAFFLLSGIFLSLSISLPFREYFDKKFVHFFYVYLIWLSMQLLITESALLVQEPAQFLNMYFLALIEPVETLWFVPMLAIFFMATRLLSDAPKFMIFLLAVFLQISFSLGWIDTGWRLPDEFFGHYVYFFAGYAAAPWLFSIARQIPEWKFSAISLLTIWAVINGLLTMNGSATTPGLGLLLGFSGAFAIVTASSLLAAQSWARWLRYCGANAIVIYLSFFLPLKIALGILAGSGWVADAGAASLLITACAVWTPLVFHWLITDTKANFLYQRPEFFRLTGNESHRLKY